jgi:hypothetical protein
LTIVLDARIAWSAGLVLALVVVVGTARAALVVRDRVRARAAHCDSEVPLESQYFVLGYGCPSPGCENTLLDCHGPDAHAVKQEVLRLLRTAVHPDSIRARVARRCPPAAPSTPEEAAAAPAAGHHHHGAGTPRTP